MVVDISLAIPSKRVKRLEFFAESKFDQEVLQGLFSAFVKHGLIAVPDKLKEGGFVAELLEFRTEEEVSHGTRRFKQADLNDLGAL